MQRIDAATVETPNTAMIDAAVTETPDTTTAAQGIEAAKMGTPNAATAAQATVYMAEVRTEVINLATLPKQLKETHWPIIFKEQTKEKV
jgi:hypothetical protein